MWRQVESVEDMTREVATLEDLVGSNIFNGIIKHSFYMEY